jgi:EAL domain-containing protein (putative c-di-GMP-specific phosphodiesterase class I)
VVLEGMQELRDVSEVGRRLLAILDEPFELAGERVTVTASIGGVIAARGGGATAGDMLRDADAAMYDAKERGRARVEVFDSDSSMRSLDRLSLRSDLERALALNELSLQYQPIVDLASGRISGFEALLRWRHPVRGFVPPDLFIPVAEENGSIVEIGRWTLRRACEQLAAWQRLPGGEGLTVSVNLSPVQLRDAGLMVDVLDAVRDAGLAPGDLWLELTERGDIASDAHGTVAQLHAAGIHFALDDFGMSHSNLAYLKRFPLEGLKIDKSFVAGVVVENPGETMDLATGADRVIIRAVLSIAQWTGMTVVAEGIETEEQLTELIALGCQRGQGYLLSRPQTVIQATALVLNAARLIPEQLQRITLSRG